MNTTPAPAVQTPAHTLDYAFQAGLHALAREWGYSVPRVYPDGTAEPADSQGGRGGDVDWVRFGIGNRGHFIPVFGHGRGSQFVKAYRHMKAALVADFCGVSHQAARDILKVLHAHDPGVIEAAVEVAEEWASLARQVPESPRGIAGPLSPPQKVAVFRIARILVRLR